MIHARNVPMALSRREALGLAMGAAIAGSRAAGQQKSEAPARNRPSSGVKMWNDIYSRPDSVVNPYPNRFLADVVQGVKPGRALDIGMGQGRNAVYLASQGWDVTGVDISEKGLDLAKEQAKRHNVAINAVLSNFDAFDLGKGQWDLISEIYMHGMIIERAPQIVESLRPNGMLVVEGFHRDIAQKGFTGEPIGFFVNELLKAFVPLLRIVRYEEVLDFGDWSMSGAKVPLVRMVAAKRS